MADADTTSHQIESLRLARGWKLQVTKYESTKQWRINVCIGGAKAMTKKERLVLDFQELQLQNMLKLRYTKRKTLFYLQNIKTAFQQLSSSFHHPAPYRLACKARF